uniref:Transmembrane protein 26b n=1 Tax=Salarias fasciatus TaxID=181472 RepID=A0A672GRR1_SALFA
MFLRFVCAVATRSLFVLASLAAVWRVVWVKQDGLYWLLTGLYLPLVAEMILTLRRRRGNDYKWFSPAIFLFLISIIPSIWILELHHRGHQSVDSRCDKLDSTKIRALFRLWNNSSGSEGFKVPLTTLCADDWILALHQILLILLVLGKWLLPAAGELTRNQLSQLLLVFVGTAADILEFTSETLADIKDSSPAMVYIILAVWTWSMLQFPLHISGRLGRRPLPPLPPQDGHLEHDGALFIQDGPFLAVRLIVMIYFDVVHQMLIFFAIKNFLVVILNVYRLLVVCCEKKS